MKKPKFFYILQLLLSVFFLYIFLKITIYFLDWAFISAIWQGSVEMCQQENAGACWPMIAAYSKSLAVGFYPFSELWRPALWIILLGVSGITLYSRLNFKKKISVLYIFLPLSSIWLCYGGWGLPIVPLHQWGGLFLSIFLAVMTGLLAMPMAIFLAIGRTHNKYPALQIVCSTLIEGVRGIPLITILFVAALIMPLLLTSNWVPSLSTRIIIGLALFQAAYLAEIIRSGLRGIPETQWQAAIMLGLKPWQIYSYILLPQTFKTMKPAILANYIGLFKATALVTIVGMNDFLSVTTQMAQDAAWANPQSVNTSYGFAALIYFSIAFLVFSLLGKKANT